MMTKIGVTGAFGFLGANFVRALLEEGGLPGAPAGELRVVAFASRTRSNPLFEEKALRTRFDERVEVESLDVLDRAGMADKFAGLDYLAHFAGLVDYRASMKRRLWDVDVLGVKAVFDAALEAGVSKLLYVSSICVLGSGGAPGDWIPGNHCDETSTPYGDPDWPMSFASADDVLSAVDASLSGDYDFLRKSKVAYIDAKIAGWELSKLYARERGLPVVTIFPGTVVGAGDIHREMSKLVDAVWEGRLRLSLVGSTSFVSARDFAKGAALALAKGKIGEGYILSGRDEHNLSYSDYQDLVASLASVERRFVKRRPPAVPRDVLLLLASLAEVLAPNSGLTRALVLSGSLRNYPCTSAKACSELGYAPSASLEPAILECRRGSETARAASRRKREAARLLQATRQPAASLPRGA
jgi:dihydroflavonol-4-reductase